jgi:hypothetical protein
MKISDIQSPRSTYELDLAKLIGSPIIEVTGYLSMEFGDPVFKLCHIYFADGTHVNVEGEHDMPYLTDSGIHSPANYNSELMQQLYDEKNEE